MSKFPFPSLGTLTTIGERRLEVMITETARLADLSELIADKRRIARQGEVAGFWFNCGVQPSVKRSAVPSPSSASGHRGGMQCGTWDWRCRDADSDLGVYIAEEDGYDDCSTNFEA